MRPGLQRHVLQDGERGGGGGGGAAHGVQVQRAAELAHAAGDGEVVEVHGGGARHGDARQQGH